MLWYKAWLETRWRFLIGLALLVCGAGAVVLLHPQVVKLLPLAQHAGPGEFGRKIREIAALMVEYRGYIWAEWQRDDLLRMGTLFAALLGTGGMLAPRSGALFTLSMPVSRTRLFVIRTATALAQFFVLAFVPMLLIPLLSPAVAQSYSIVDALVHALCFFFAGAVVLSLAVLLSSIFDDVWRPLLIALFVAAAVGIAEQVFRAVEPYGLFRVMSGESWFRGGDLPWVGLLSTAAVSAALLYGAAMNVARRDF